jgi:hypothetical protein
VRFLGQFLVLVGGGYLNEIPQPFQRPRRRAIGRRHPRLSMRARHNPQTPERSSAHLHLSRLGLSRRRRALADCVAEGRVKRRWSFSVRGRSGTVALEVAVRFHNCVKRRGSRPAPTPTLEERWFGGFRDYAGGAAPPTTEQARAETDRKRRIRWGRLTVAGVGERSTRTRPLLEATTT